MEKNIQIMNHQVKDYIYIDSPYCESIHTMGLNKYWIGQKGFHLDHGRIEALYKSHLKDQILFQGVFTVALLLLAPLLFTRFQGTPGFGFTLRITLVAVFFHLLLLTLLNFLFYMELFTAAMVSSLVFLLVNFGISMMDGIPGFSILPGVSYLISTAAASGVAGYALFSSAKILDRRLLAKSVT